MEQTENQNKKTWDWKSRKPNNIIRIEAGPTTGFFKWWLIYMRPMVDLTNKEVDVVASFLKHRYEISKKVFDRAILDSQVMSNDTKRKVIEECGITQQHFYVVMSTLRRKNVITEFGINPKVIPNIREDDNGYFQFLLLFKDPEYKDGEKK
jgi:DNA-directed RNA polymerase subunit H (RpoH/RPB5)